MNIDNDLIKEYLKNVYFINGTAYAGKSTVCKMLAEKYDMIHCEENYNHRNFLEMSSLEKHPNMNYFNTMKSWEEFVTRSVDDYCAWLRDTAKEMTEFEILELISLSKHKKVIVDTNIPHDVLLQISDRSRVAYMVTTTKISTNEFFNRVDEEKQFLFNVIKNTDEPDKNLQNMRNIIEESNSKEVIESFTKSGFFYTFRETVDDDISEKLAQIETHFGLGKK